MCKSRALDSRAALPRGTLTLASTTPAADEESMLKASCCCFALTKSANSSGISEKERTPSIFQREPAIHPHWYAAPER